MDPLVAVGGVGGHPEAPRRGLPHPPRDLLGKIFAVELVHALDDGFEELACGGVVGLLGDGDDSDALAPEQGFEGDCVLALACEAGELPDQNLPERGVGLAGRVDHLAELRPVGDVPAFGLVHVLAGDEVPVLACIVSERPQLCGNGKVHVLTVAGHPGVEGHWRGLRSFTHLHVIQTGHYPQRQSVRSRPMDWGSVAGRGMGPHRGGSDRGPSIPRIMVTSCVLFT